MAHSEETRQQFVILRAGGKPFAEISETLNVSKPTLIGWSREMRSEIANLKSIETEKLLADSYATKEACLALVREQIGKMLNELNKRDYSDLSTERLAKLLVEYLAFQKGERVAVTLEKKHTMSEALSADDMDMNATHHIERWEG